MTVGELQAYGYFILTALLVFLLYGYIFHLYRSQKTGKRDYEKYGRIALDDDITSEPVEPHTKKEKKGEA
ncbi:MAG: cytochrome C oxidase subunit III [Sulfuricurvum sp. PC08-66]|nr:MAG: cytochrome C oxidase subunit III [Sulfuricurvum sp. PC08-66]